jgi:hypothetical protein
LEEVKEEVQLRNKVKWETIGRTVGGTLSISVSPFSHQWLGSIVFQQYPFLSKHIIFVVLNNQKSPNCSTYTILVKVEFLKYDFFKVPPAINVFLLFIIRYFNGNSN